MLQTLAPSDSFSFPASSQVDAWSVIRRTHSHVLVVGSAASVNPALAQLHPYLRGPVMYWRPAVATEPPWTTRGALVIWDVDTLDGDQQKLLLAWMEGGGAKVQMVSIAERPVFPLVLQKVFLEALYYRLNTLYVALEDSPDDLHHTAA
jgi:hypothetical protein